MPVPVNKKAEEEQSKNEADLVKIIQPVLTAH
jgi:hypothetical protein